MAGATRGENFGALLEDNRSLKFWETLELS